MNSSSRFIARLGLGLAFGAIVGACEDEPNLEPYCANKESLIAGCADQTYECEESPCYEHCTALGEEARKFSGACGELWIEIYECFVEMSCEEVEAWVTAQSDDTFEYPCGELESKYREACPEVPLYSPNN